MSKYERSDFRDPDLGPWHHAHGFNYPLSEIESRDLSLRHRKWGDNCPGVDIDWPYVEYDKRFPIALIDYKLRIGLIGKEPERTDANYLALSRLCTSKGPIPIFAVFYQKEPWAFRPIWINTQAKQLMPKNGRLTEEGYVVWLHWLRGRIVDASVKELDNYVLWDLPVPLAVQRGSRRRARNTSPIPTLFDPTPLQQVSFWEEPPV